MDRIEVTIDQAAGKISVWNNGRGIPIEIHKEHNCYVPELIFGRYNKEVAHIFSDSRPATHIKQLRRWRGEGVPAAKGADAIFSDRGG